MAVTLSRFSPVLNPRFGYLGEDDVQTLRYVAFLKSRVTHFQNYKTQEMLKRMDDEHRCHT